MESENRTTVFIGDLVCWLFVGVAHFGGEFAFIGGVGILCFTAFGVIVATYLWYFYNEFMEIPESSITFLLKKDSLIETYKKNKLIRDYTKLSNVLRAILISFLGGWMIVIALIYFVSFYLISLFMRRFFQRIELIHGVKIV